MKCTDLVSVVPWFKGKPVPYACKVNKRLAPEADKFFMETVREGVSANKYVNIFLEENHLSPLTFPTLRNHPILTISL